MLERLLYLRKNILKLSQNDFAQKIGFKQTSYSEMERGINMPSDRVIYLICSKFNVNEIWIRTGKGEIFNTHDVLFEQLFEIYEHLSQPLQQFLLDMAKKLLDIQNSDN